MKTPIPNSLCPKCGGALPAEAQQAICPKCALAAVAAPTEGDETSTHRGPPPALDVVAAAFPQLEILELIGQGGMGAVYRARQPKLDRPVALKLLAVPAGGGGTFAERFHREARLLARLSHPGIVTVHDYGETGGFFYLLMEYVDGVNLRQAMRAGRFTPAQALALVPKICEALQYAHDEGILHRDIKPENLLLDTRGRVKIADFGIAKLLGDKATDATLTASGLAVGTPHYMAPEQLERPQDVDQRADIYSLGVVFYEMLTGELPIGRFAPPSQKTPVDPRVDDIVLRALEKERERRQPNVTQVKTEVEQITGTPASAPRVPATKTSLCYVSTPEHLRTLTGRFLYIYQGNGQLRLDERSLNFTSGWHSVTIPLASIRSLARGEYSFAAKPLPLHYIEVTFEDHGAVRTLLFTPTRSGLLPAWETNKDVAEWLGAIQAAVEKTTGRVMPLSRASGIGRGWSELLKSFALTALLCMLVFLAIPLLAEQRPPNRWTDYLPGPLVAAISFGLGLSLRAFMERRALTHKNLDCLTRLPGSSAAPDAGRHGAVSVDGAPAQAGNVSVTTAERHTRCFFSNPERLRRCFPSATTPLFHCAGDLRLTADQILFTSALRATVTIPLRQIRALGVGVFRMWNTPWLGTRYERLHYLVITSEEDGILKTVVLTPIPERADCAAAINRCAGEWHDAVLEAIRVLGLPAPSPPPKDLLLAGVQENWWRVMGPLLGVSLIATLATVLFTDSPNPWLLLGSFIPSMIICLLSIGFFRMNSAIQQGRLDSFTGEEPPESSVCPVARRRSRPAADKGISWSAIVSALCSLPTWWIVMGLLVRLHATLGPDGLPPRVFLIGLWELTTACTGVVAFSLGVRALRNIRVSAGEIRGATWAIIGLLALPAGCLVKLGPQLMASAARGVGWQPTAEQGALFVGATLIGILILLVGAAWRLRQWSQPAKSGSP
jgi:serine/threonine protein kinase